MADCFLCWGALITVIKSTRWIANEVKPRFTLFLQNGRFFSPFLRETNHLKLTFWPFMNPWRADSLFKVEHLITNGKNMKKKKKKKKCRHHKSTNDFDHYIISSGDTVYPSTWTLSAGGIRTPLWWPAARWLGIWAQIKSVISSENSAGKSGLSACLALKKQHYFFCAINISSGCLFPWNLKMHYVSLENTFLILFSSKEKDLFYA